MDFYVLNHNTAWLLTRTHSLFHVGSAHILKGVPLHPPPLPSECLYGTWDAKETVSPLCAAPTLYTFCLSNDTGKRRRSQLTGNKPSNAARQASQTSRIPFSVAAATDPPACKEARVRKKEAWCDIALGAMKTHALPKRRHSWSSSSPRITPAPH